MQFFFFYIICVSFVSQVLTLNGTNVHNDIIFIHLIWSHVISLNAFQGTRDEKRKRQKNFLEIWPSQNKQNNKIHYIPKLHTQLNKCIKYRI